MFRWSESLAPPIPRALARSEPGLCRSGMLTARQLFLIIVTRNKDCSRSPWKKPLPPPAGCWEEADAQLVAHGHPLPCSARVSIRGSVLVVCTSYSAGCRYRLSVGRVWPAGAGRGLRVHPQECPACHHRTLCLHAESALSRLYPDRRWVHHRLAQLVDRRCHAHHVSGDLSSGDPRRRGLPELGISGIPRLRHACAPTAAATHSVEGAY